MSLCYSEPCTRLNICEEVKDASHNLLAIYIWGKFQEISFCKSVLSVGVATGKYGCCAANGYAAAAAAAVWRRLTGVGGADA